MADSLRLMCILAHPDDESLGTGGTLAKYAAEGVETYLVTATRGQRGWKGAVDDYPGPAALAEVRSKELDAAAEVLGIRQLWLLDHMDGALVQVDAEGITTRIAQLIRHVRPQVVVTFGPDGIYGHYDHIAVHRWTTIAVELAADATCFPHHVNERCEPHQVSKLYYRVISEEQIQAMRERGEPAAMMMDGVPFSFVGPPMAEITTVIDVSQYVEHKLRAIRCHATQVGRGSRFSDVSADAQEDPLLAQEHFVLARSRVGWPAGVETDLFDRLR